MLSSDFERAMSDVHPADISQPPRQYPQHVDLRDAMQRAGLIPEGTWLTASAVLLAFRLQKAVVDDTISVTLVRKQVAQMIFEARKARMATADPRVDFNKHAFVPEFHSMFNGYVLLHEDDNHKRKLWTSHTRWDQTE